MVGKRVKRKGCIYEKIKGPRKLPGQRGNNDFSMKLKVGRIWNNGRKGLVLKPLARCAIFPPIWIHIKFMRMILVDIFCCHLVNIDYYFVTMTMVIVSSSVSSSE